MDLGFRYLSKAETRRLISFLGISIALILVLQYSELPNSKFLSSLTAKITSFTMDTSLANPNVESNNNMNVNASNSSSTNSLAMSPQVTSSVVYNGKVTSSEDNEGDDSVTTASVLAPQPSPVISVYKDEKSSFLQGSTPKIGDNKPVISMNSKRKPSKVVSLSEMNLQLQHSHASSKKPAASSSAVHMEILQAKSEIENAPIVMNDSRLYSPLYRNVSMFRRSYELMEKMLKVFIYPDGDKPIFHEPLLDGIYASEGWFIKLIEGNKQFTTGDPNKAHLFYIPFSSRLLQLTLYVRNSHRRSNLIDYMKNYVDIISGKYPFWNTTNGSDHFLVACHDWAPAETRGRMLNCIRALCNADIEVGFKIGKDVSLPETYIRSAENPVKNLGGNPPSQRPILAFFAGGLHGYVRPVLLKYWENKEPDMKISGPLPHVKGNTNYIELMKSSKFCICARGHEVNSPRVVEAIFHECIPVIISDNFIPPLFEVLNWESFAVFIKEKHIAYLRDVLLSISEERYLEMHKRVKMVQEHFIWHHEPVKYDLFHMLLHSIWYNRIFYVS
ncbi:probable glycosyltransferase At3g07620 [Cicer arietinum]|uniref:Probable glycosyltransferase At5g03795 n=1 Tax=Cicer arietinum TaxID=3827 RepID=A0A1S2Y9W2_CICAR|nr:probable glycosyltransferase At5g03795 [Cicer arietinum]